MTPLRREIHIPIYWLVVGLMVMVVSPLLSILVSVQIANHNREQADRAASLAAAQAREDGRQRTCALFAGLLDAYIQEPPQTDAGKLIRQTYLRFYNEDAHCTPRRTQ